jgi:nickel-dependent lactate racemase
MDGVSLRKKLGDDVMERFLVYNHNPYENCTPLGKTSFGTPVEINAEFMECDLRIGIGCIVPHRRAGFGGGAKIVLPGVSSITTTEANHSRVKYSDSTGIGCYDDNVCQLDMQEACRMARLDIKIDVLLNMKREISHVFVGEPLAEHAAGVAIARNFYATDPVDDVDIVVGNCYFKANEMVLAPGVLSALLKKEGGDMVLLVVTPEGQMVHYWSRSFGKRFGGRGWYQRTRLPVNTKRISIVAPYPDKVGLDWVAPYEQTNRFRSWDGALRMLRETYGEKARVAVVPDASIQYFPERKANKAQL